MLERRFDALKQAAPPDLWPDIQRRDPRPPRREVPWGRLGTATVAFAVAAAGVAFAARAFLGEPARQGGAASPTGTLAFVVRDDPSAIHVMDADGSGTRRILHGRDPAWSPDGSRIAFRRGRTDEPGGLTNRIYVAEADGSNVQVLYEAAGGSYGEPGGAGPPAWSPDGTQIAFAGMEGLFTIDADGSNVRRIVANEKLEGCYALEPSWSPDGSQIAFAGRCDGGDLGIFIVGAEGGPLTQLTRGLDTYPVWSPDGSQMAFVRRANDPPLYASAIYVMDADGSSPTRVASAPHEGFYEYPPSWSPDGTQIAFTNAVEGRLYVVDQDGTSLHPITEAGLDACCPAWQPASPTTVVPTQEESDEVIVRGPTVTVPLGGMPDAIVAAEGDVWVSVRTIEDGPADPRLVRIDQATNEIVSSIPLDMPIWDLTAAGGAVWGQGYVQTGDDVLLRIDPATNEVVESIPLDDYVGPLIADATGVWVMTTEEGTETGGEDDLRRLVYVDAATNQITASTPIEGYVDDMGLTEGSVWLMRWGASPGGHERCGQVLRVDTATSEVADVIPADGLNLAAGADAVWVSCREDPEGTFVARRIDLGSSAVSEPIPLPGGYGPTGIIEDGAWFTGYDGQGRVRVFFMDDATHEISGMVRLQDGSYTGAAFDPATSTIWIAHTSGGGSAVRIDLPF